MQGSIWLMLLRVALFGGVGGVVNAIMTENGFVAPRSEKTSTGTQVLRPGVLGNVLIGCVAAVVSWGLYSPLSAYLVVGMPEALARNSSGSIGLTLASLVGALLVGIGGARWLSSEVDKSLLRAAATEAASKEASPQASRQIAMASPAQALDVAKSMK